jgi:heme oxygenase (biliverdin-IX-beta and delta-forming)
MADAAPFSPTVAAKRVLRLAATASLATLNAHGSPYASLVTVATAPDGSPILLLSNLAVHTKNLARDRRASLLLVEPGGETGDPLAGARLTLNGTVTRDTDPVLRRRFLARHVEATGYAGFADFAFYRFAVAAGHLVAGFGRIVDLGPADILAASAAVDHLLDAEEGAIAHMNEDHREAIGLYATRLLGLPPSDWRISGVDPEGVDLRAGSLRGRLAFPQPVHSPGDLRQALVALAKAAREAD